MVVHSSKQVELDRYGVESDIACEGTHLAMARACPYMTCQLEK